MPISSSIRERRVHHQLYPHDLEIEQGFPNVILNKNKRKNLL